MIRDEDDATVRGQVLDAERLGTEVMTIEKPSGRRGDANAVSGQSEWVVAKLVAVDDERLRAAVDVIDGHVIAKLTEAVEQTHSGACNTLMAMSDAFVDLSYRGLVLGKRIKLTQVRQATGYLEMPTPMPVGTAIGIAADDGTLFEALVAEIHEQVGGSDKAPGMVVKPKLEGDAQRTWWTQHIEKVTKEAPQPDAEGRVTVRSARMTGKQAVPELVDDGRNTSVMEAVGDDTVIAPPLDVENLRDTNPSTPIMDDGKHTVAMDAVDLAALGLDPASSSGSMPVVTDEDSSGKPKKKKKKR